MKHFYADVERLQSFMIGRRYPHPIRELLEAVLDGLTNGGAITVVNAQWTADMHVQQAMKALQAEMEAWDKDTLHMRVTDGVAAHLTKPFSSATECGEVLATADWQAAPMDMRLCDDCVAALKEQQQ